MVPTTRATDGKGGVELKLGNQWSYLLESYSYGNARAPVLYDPDSDAGKTVVVELQYGG